MNIKSLKSTLFFGIVLSTSFLSNLAGADSGEQIYQQHCAMCHAEGVDGAPKKGDASAWQGRGSIDELVHYASVGKGGMPPHGGCTSCSKSEIKAAIEYMMQ